MTDLNNPQAEQVLPDRNKTPPPNPSNQPSVTETPIYASRAGMEQHGTAPEPDRQSNFESFRRDISGKIIGPMPARKFLDDFIPLPSSDPSSKCTRPLAKLLDKIRECTTELTMYNPFIKAFETFLTDNVKFVDNHTGCLLEWDGRRVSPDVVLVDGLDTFIPKSSTTFERRNIEGVGVMLEFKLDGDASDPFSDTDTTSFERNSKDYKDPKLQTLGQICAYATAQMANQFRSHVFSVLVFNQYARLLRWDRAGLIVTEKIPFTPAAAHPLAEFFYRYARATPEERGMDPNTVRLDLDYPELTPAVKGALDKQAEGPFYLVTIQTKSFIIAVPHSMATASPTGRSTRTFKAYDPETKKFVFMKDSWRIISSSLKPEHETYAALVAAGVHYIPTVVTYDMNLQQTKTCLAIKPDTKRGNQANKFRKFQHYRLVLKEYAKRLVQFSNVKELLTAFTDAIQAHHEACELAHILHRDISAGNIMIDENGRGLLIDWDLSKSTIERHEASLPERTGTWQFIAYRLVALRKDDEPMPIHVKDDDLESFWHVLFWLAMRHAEHGQPTSAIEALMKNVYDNRQQTETGTACPETKYDKLLNPLTVRKQKFASLPLVNILEEFQQIICSRYHLQEADKETFFMWQQQILKEFPKATEAEVWDKLDSIIKKDSRFRYINSRNALFLFLKNDWALELCRNVCTTTAEVDWKVGGTNKYRPELFNSRQSSRNKRQSDSQYISSGNDADDNDRPRNKKARKDSALPSIHEEGGKPGNAN